MTKTLKFAVFATLFSAAASVYGQNVLEELARLRIAVAGERIEAPDFELDDLDGKPRKLSSYREKVVFLNFWATWCGPCRFEMPSMQLPEHL